MAYQKVRMNPSSLPSKITVVFIALITLCAHAQQELAGAKVTRSGGDLVVSVDASRPLYFAVLALSEQYGWVVDYEDPIYSHVETRDKTDQSWRKAHPAELGFWVPSGGKFVANLGKSDQNHPGELGLLEDLVRQYNQTNNPGDFRVIQAEGQPPVITGHSRLESNEIGGSPLDRLIPPNVEKQTASDALNQVTTLCGTPSGIPIVLGTLPNNLLNRFAVDGFTEPTSCRERHLRILSQVHFNLTYAFLYDVSSHTYVLNIVPARRTIVGTDGMPTSVPLQNPSSKYGFIQKSKFGAGCPSFRVLLDTRVELSTKHHNYRQLQTTENKSLPTKLANCSTWNKIEPSFNSRKLTGRVKAIELTWQTHTRSELRDLVW